MFFFFGKPLMLLIPTTKSALFYFDKQLVRNSHVKFNFTHVFSHESMFFENYCGYYEKVLLLLQFS